MNYRLVLKSLSDTDEKITLGIYSSLEAAQDARKSWRRLLGGKAWTVDRRPNLDTLDCLALTIERGAKP